MSCEWITRARMMLFNSYNDNYPMRMFDIKVMKSWIKLSPSAESPLNFLGGTSHLLSILNSHQTYIPNWWTPCYEANKCDKKLEIKLDQISRHDQYQKMSKYQTKYQNLTNYHPSTKYQNLTKHQKLTKYTRGKTSGWFWRFCNCVIGVIT